MYIEPVQEGPAKGVASAEGQAVGPQMYGGWIFRSREGSCWEFVGNSSGARRLGLRRGHGLYIAQGTTGWWEDKS